MTDIENYMADNAIIQITFMPASQLDIDDTTVEWPAQYSVVIGNNRYFGFTIEEAVRKSQ